MARQVRDKPNNGAGAEAPRFAVRPDINNHFAWLRTKLGLQRTLMASVRTGVSLIGFGFTVAQFFEHMQSQSAEPFDVELPRNLGMMLIGAGVLSLGVATWQYRKATAYLNSAEFEVIAGIGGPRQRSMHAATYFAAMVVILIGVVALASVFWRF
jgi:putative membrane protein